MWILMDSPKETGGMASIDDFAILLNSFIFVKCFKMAPHDKHVSQITIIIPIFEKDDTEINKANCPLPIEKGKW